MQQGTDLNSPRDAPSSKPGPLLALAALSLVITVSLGTWLRGVFAAWLELGAFSFPHVRHAHSHLGYFGVLFPLAFVAWHEASGRAPGPRLTVVYGAASLGAALGFLIDGYTVFSIAGSTVVGAVWLHAAFRNRGALKERDAWIANGPPAIVVAACMIPPIGVLTPRDPELAQRLVQSFLALLLLGVITPAALNRLNARRFPWPLWSSTSLVAALSLGVVDLPLARVGLVAVGVMLVGAVARGAGSSLARALFVVWGLGLVAMGLGLLENTRPIAIAGVHFAVLGPLLLSLWPSPRAFWNHAFASLAVVMSSALIVAVYVPALGLEGQRVAAVAGALLVVLALVRVMSELLLIRIADR